MALTSDDKRVDFKRPHLKLNIIFCHFWYWQNMDTETGLEMPGLS